MALAAALRSVRGPLALTRPLPGSKRPDASSSSLKTIAGAAEKSGVADVMDNVRLFAAALQKEGIDTASILKYLKIAKGLAQNDPGTFAEIFSDESGTASDTITAMTADGSE